MSFGRGGTRSYKAQVRQNRTEQNSTAQPQAEAGAGAQARSRSRGALVLGSGMWDGDVGCTRRAVAWVRLDAAAGSSSK
jgi:hypothetical protein